MENPKKRRRRGGVTDFAGVVRGLAACLADLDAIPKRYAGIDQEEPAHSILERGRAYAYLCSVQLTAIEKRDDYERYEELIARLEQKCNRLMAEVQQQRERRMQ